jgi:hypothetical protein
MKKITIATALILFSITAVADDVNVKDVIAESLIEGTREGICGDRVTVQWMMRSADEKIRRQGNACFSLLQAEKINGRLNGNVQKIENGKSTVAQSSSTSPRNQKSVSKPQVEANQCRNEKGIIKCKIWFQETTLNGEVVPAGFRDVDMGQN